MTIIYFMQLAKKCENLPFIRNFVNWFAKCYNLNIKVIYLDNKMNQIKIVNKCNKNGIFFQPYTLDTHI